MSTTNDPSVPTHEFNSDPNLAHDKASPIDLLDRWGLISLLYILFSPKTRYYLNGWTHSNFDRLYHRHHKSKDILGSEVIAAEHSEVTLEREIDIEQLTRDDSFLGNIGGLAAEAVLSHMSVLDRFRSQAELLPEYLLSAKRYTESQPRMFFMLKYQEEYHPVIFNLSNKKFENEYKDELRIFDLIACTESEPIAAIQAADIERLANQTVVAWCALKNIAIDRVSKICGLYLVPVDESINIRQFLVGINDLEE